MTIRKQVKIKSSRDKRKKYVITFYKGGVCKCSCPHFIFRLNGTGEVCKHITQARKRSAA